MAAKKKKPTSKKNDDRTVPVYETYTSGKKGYTERWKQSELRKNAMPMSPDTKVKKGYVTRAYKMNSPRGVDVVAETAPKKVTTRKGTVSGKAKKK